MGKEQALGPWSHASEPWLPKRPDKELQSRSDHQEPPTKDPIDRMILALLHMAKHDPLEVEMRNEPC
jgi:hypothetical protein